jgi:hypothetical protein
VFGALKIVPLKWQECMLWEDIERSTNLLYALSAALTSSEVWLMDTEFI